MVEFSFNTLCGRCFNKGEVVYCRVDKVVHHFLNTKEPYMLKHCPKCETSYLILPVGE